MRTSYLEALDPQSSNNTVGRGLPLLDQIIISDLIELKKLVLFYNIDWAQFHIRQYVSPPEQQREGRTDVAFVGRISVPDTSPLRHNADIDQRQRQTAVELPFMMSASEGGRS